jgi:hypothetical protein
MDNHMAASALDEIGDQMEDLDSILANAEKLAS